MSQIQQIHTNHKYIPNKNRVNIEIFIRKAFSKTTKQSKRKTLIYLKIQTNRCQKKDPLEMKDLEREREKEYTKFSKLHQLFITNFTNKEFSQFELLKSATESIIERTLTRQKRFFSTTTTTTKTEPFLTPNSPKQTKNLGALVSSFYT